MALTANYEKTFPVSTLGTGEIEFFVVDMGSDVATNSSASDSLFSNAIKGLQTVADLYMIGTPVGNTFTIAVRAGGCPGSNPGAITGINSKLGLAIATTCGEEVVLSVAISNGGSLNDVGDVFEFSHASLSKPIIVEVTASDAGGVATQVALVDGGEWIGTLPPPATTALAGFTRTQTYGPIDTNGSGLNVYLTWGIGGVNVYHASIVGDQLVYND